MPTTHHPIVGTVRWKKRSDETLELLDGWAKSNIVAVEIPELRGVPTFGGSFGGKVAFYRGAAEQLAAAWKEVGRQGLTDRVLFWSGSFVPRLVRGSRSTPSNHSFGTAFDINHQWNGLGVTPPPAGQRGSVRELVPIFEKYGFFWGGNYRRRKDGMHFEVARLGLPEAASAPDSLEVFFNDRQEAVPALRIDSKAWIGARALANRLSGRINKIEKSPLTITLTLNGAEKEYPARIVGEVGYVGFADVMERSKVHSTYDPRRLRIDIRTP